MADLQLTMAKQEATIACQKGEIEDMHENLSRKALELADKNHELEKINNQMTALQKEFEESENAVRKIKGSKKHQRVCCCFLRLFSKVTVCC